MRIKGAIKTIEYGGRETPVLINQETQEVNNVVEKVQCYMQLHKVTEMFIHADIDNKTKVFFGKIQIENSTSRNVLKLDNADVLSFLSENEGFECAIAIPDFDITIVED